MSVSLTVRYEGPEQSSGLQAYGLRVTVTTATGMSPKIFVFHRRVPSATDAEARAMADPFQCIADPVDMHQYPEDSPDPQNEMPYYRLNQVTLAFRAMDELHEARTLMDRDIQKLVTAMKQLDAEASGWTEMETVDYE